MDPDTGKVLGLHHMGFRTVEIGGVGGAVQKSSREGENQAIYLWRILQDIDRQNHGIYNEIANP
jgi:hypothetical protein